MEACDEQLENIDKQLTEAMAKEMEEQREKLKEHKSARPKTKEELQNQRLADITELSAGLEQAKAVDSAKTRVDGDARVLESEIQLDRMHGVSESTVAEKEAELSDIKQKSMELTASIGERISEVTEEVKEGSETSVPEDSADTKSANTDL